MKITLYNLPYNGNKKSGFMTKISLFCNKYDLDQQLPLWRDGGGESNQPLI